MISSDPKPKPDQCNLGMDIFNIKETLTWQNKGLIKQKYHTNSSTDGIKGGA